MNKKEKLLELLDILIEICEEDDIEYSVDYGDESITLTPKENFNYEQRD